ncbi:MAG: monovalent cation:proton antiporter-2 (CPA2) family protein [Gammaproteobacteria bacterium]|nr:monovalent cation:proton antiporter-2 (CPA2) family protein [Gammaproteobacteria bacterium]
MTLLQESAIFFGAAIVSVPVFKRLGFGAVLGYLAAGVIIGPWGFGLIDEVEDILHFSELGVVFLLFVIGLELQPSRLWVLRKQVFGLGMSQVLVTGFLLALVAYLLGLGTNAALVAGFGLALSSTAFVLQMLAEKQQLTTVHGRSAFAILLFQDLAVIPLLAMVPLLGISSLTGEAGNTWLGVTQTVFAVVVLILGGRYLLRHVFRAIARWGSDETFTAAALFIVIGAALLMEWVDLSMGLGAFIAGMLLADSEYRHQLEADIAPFKGLLLGLFFIAVGMAVDIGLLLTQVSLVLGLTIGLLLVKGVVLLGLARAFRLGADAARNLAFSVSQGGEFAFVLFGVAAGSRVLDQATVDLLIVVVTFSMILTPLLFILNEKYLDRWLHPAAEPDFDTIQGEENPVIIAGFGRVGQIVGRILQMRRIPFTALEHSPDQVDLVRRYGNRVYYGEPSRLSLLRAANADKAKVFVLALDDVEESLKTARVVRHYFPSLKIYAAARDRYHALRLMDIGVAYFIRETVQSSLRLSEAVLQGLDVDQTHATQAVDTFAKFDEELLKKQHAVHHDESKLIQTATEASEELESLFASAAE